MSGHTRDITVNRHIRINTHADRKETKTFHMGLLFSNLKMQQYSCPKQWLSETIFGTLLLSVEHARRNF